MDFIPGDKLINVYAILTFFFYKMVLINSKNKWQKLNIFVLWIYISVKTTIIIFTIIKVLINIFIIFFFLFQAVIFVIDSTNTERLSEAHDELAKLLAEKRLENALILIYANKQVGGMLQTTLVFFYLKSFFYSCI